MQSAHLRSSTVKSSSNRVLAVGLALIRSITELFGGQCEIRGSRSDGTTITVVLKRLTMMEYGLEEHSLEEHSLEEHW
jgi:signal transduction histidine kinase